MKEKRTERKRLIVLILSFTALLILLFFLLLSIINQYSQQLVQGRTDNYLAIVRDISISIENEVSQTEQALQFFVRTNDFRDALDLFTKEEYSWPLNRIALSFCVYYSRVIDNMIISHNEDLSGQIWSLKRKYYQEIATVSDTEFASLRIYLSEKDPNEAYLGITVADAEGYDVTAMLSLGLMYERLVSHIKFTESLDLMVMNSDGLIIMSSFPQVIGNHSLDIIDSLNGQKETMVWKNILEHQKQRESGSETFDGMLYGQKKAARNLSVYAPAILDSGFWIVSSISDYKQVIQAANETFYSVSLIVSIIFIVLFSLLGSIIVSYNRKNKVEKENRYLKELNKTLQYVNENERMRNHEQRLEIIGTMTCGIAHEFNNLLTPIMGYSGMLLAQKNIEDPEYEDLKGIYDASERAKEIIQQISGFGRKNGDMTFHQISVSAFLLQVQRLANGLMPLLVTFSYNPQNNDGYFFGNATQLTQVLMNIILNSVDAIGGHEGKIAMSYSISEHESLRDISELYDQNINFGSITISDNGCGMDQETIDQLFKPFFTTKTTTGGNGLGLLISSNIIKAHHGKILISSVPGTGTIFTIYLPISDKAIDEPKSSIDSLKKTSGKTYDILAVDDDPNVLRFYEKGLSKLGNDVTKISDGQDAWQIVKRHQYDVLIIDDSLKNMSGLALAMRIRQKWPMMTIILVSGTVRKETVDAFRTGIINGYLLKPVTIGELMDQIHEARKS